MESNISFKKESTQTDSFFNMIQVRHCVFSSMGLLRCRTGLPVQPDVESCAKHTAINSLFFVFRCNFNWTLNVLKVLNSYTVYTHTQTFWVIHVTFAVMLESFPLPYCVPTSFLWNHNNIISVCNCVMSPKHRVGTTTLWGTTRNIRKPVVSPYIGWHVSWSSSQVDVDLPWFTPTDLEQ